MRHEGGPPAVAAFALVVILLGLGYLAAVLSEVTS